MDEATWLATADTSAMLRFITENPDHANIVCVRSPRRLRLFACACCRSVFHLLTDARSRRAVEVAEAFADGAATEDEMNLAFEAAVDAEPTATRDDAVVTTLLAIPHLRWLDGEFLGRLRQLGLPPAAQAALLREVVGNPFRPVTLPKCGRCDGDGKAHGSDRPFEWSPETGYPGPCPVCDGSGNVYATRGSTVLALAAAAYGEPRRVKCGRCGGECVAWDGSTKPTCPDCSGTGTTTDGLLDAERLGVLADALEDAGCDDAALLGHLRATCPACTDKSGFVWGKVADCRACHGSGHAPHARGCWALDLLLGKD